MIEVALEAESELGNIKNICSKCFLFRYSKIILSSDSNHTHWKNVYGILSFLSIWLLHEQLFCVLQYFPDLKIVGHIGHKDILLLHGLLFYVLQEIPY